MPNPPAPSSKADTGVSRSTRGSAAMFTRPLLDRSKYAGTIEMPWLSTPCRSAHDMTSAVRAAKPGFMPQAVSNASNWARWSA